MLLAVPLALVVIGVVRSVDTSSEAAHVVVLTRGDLAGVSWQLEAGEVDGRLCLSMHSATQPDSTAPYGSLCSFGETGQDVPFLEGYLKSSNQVFFAGPAPEAATSVKLATHLTVPTYPMPKGVGLPTARYWVEAMTLPPPSQWGVLLNGPILLTAAGQVVPFGQY
jgi:hypothetical protein